MFCFILKNFFLVIRRDILKNRFISCTTVNLQKKKKNFGIVLKTTGNQKRYRGLGHPRPWDFRISVRLKHTRYPFPRTLLPSYYRIRPYNYYAPQPPQRVTANFSRRLRRKRRSEIFQSTKILRKTFGFYLYFFVFFHFIHAFRETEENGRDTEQGRGGYGGRRVKSRSQRQ